MGILRSAVGVALALTLAGCAFTGLRKEPKLAEYRYDSGSVPTMVRGLAVTVDVSDCIDVAMVNYHGIFGGRSFNGTVPLKQIVRREFEKMVADVYRAPSDGEREQVMIKVDSKTTVIDQRMSTSNCEMSFDVQVVDPMNEGIKPYYRGSFTRKCTCRHQDDEVVPQSVYDAVTGVVEEFLKELSEDRNAVRRLSAIPRSDVNKKPAELKDVKFGAIKNGRLTGECTVACNDWEGFDTDRWARGNIKEQCQAKLGIDPSRVRLVFTKDEFSAEAKLWKYSFVAFSRTELVMDFNPDTRSGVCIGDLEMMKQSAPEASKVMVKYILAELRRHGGAVVDEKGDLNTLVRFDDYKTDRENNQIIMTFRLVY